ncbi:2917_t:CDS:2, partial [Diversispora eburnea]
MSSELALLRQENDKLMGENMVLMVKIVELEQIIAKEILNEEPLIEYCPPQKYQIAIEDVVNRDRLKRSLCQDNGIFLLEVWYDENSEIVIPERIQKIKGFINQA